MDKLSKVINEVEKEQGKPFSKKEKKFALVLAATGNKTEAARQAGYKGAHLSSQGYKMAQDPKIQELVEEISKFQSVEITEDLITQGILKEALQADAPRDRLNAYQLLAKSKGMLKDVVEQTNHDRSDDDLIEAIRKEFGDAAAEKARAELGQ